MGCILGIDLGTSSVKVLALPEDAGEFVTATWDYPLLSPVKGGAEQNPRDWWEAIRRALGELRGKGCDLDQVESIGFSGQMHGLVALDREGTLLRPAILHCDTRSEAYRGALSTEELIECGILNPLFPGFQLASLLWMRDNEPELYGRIGHILSPKDYVRYRMTGELGAEWSDASATLLYDVRDGRWSERAIALLGLGRDVLPEVSSPFALAGTLTAKAAEELGLPMGVPVAFGGADQPMQALGNGVLKPGEMICTVGSGGQVFFLCDNPAVNPTLSTHTFRYATENAWYGLGAMLTAGASLQWYRDGFLPGEDLAALDREVEKTLSDPPLLFLPYINGERSPHLDPNARGTVYGLSLCHNRYHLARAVMEGVCFAMRDSVEVFRSLGLTAAHTVASGGYTKSPLWLKMMASALNRPLLTTRARGSEAALGAAITAAVACGRYASPGDAVAACVRYRDEPVQPDAALAALYEEQYGRFRQLYAGTKALGEV